ncbi:mannose-1-phosphate guanylyltransferase [Candidatus Uhrbacteria bacterium]|nr:mannose-1-phosphate guanylyltransferase [Candidatus Uhrbacteria bacterium]
MKAVILAGGVGTRLWPLSRANRPKQFTALLSEEPLLKDTYRRLLRLLASEDIFFSTSPAFASMIQELFPDVPADRIIVEPVKRDTGPAMGFAAMALFAIAPDEPMVFIPSDHYIRDEEKFLDCLRVAGCLVEETGKLLDIGVVATFPSTILGYTRIGPRVSEKDGVEVYTFRGQHEKPSYDVAKSYLEAGDYLWHANYFTWTPRKFLEAFDMYAPEMGHALRAGAFESLLAISFDYAVVEKLDPNQALIIKGDFGWSDIGAWDTLYARLAEDDRTENVLHGDVLTIDARGNLVHVTGEKLVALLGVSNLVVVDTPDALLVTTHAHAQRVKEIIAELSARGAHHIL